MAAQICLRDAWPAPETMHCCGWTVRAGRGGYNRANSVWTGAFDGDLAQAVERVEAFYRERGLRPRFQVLDIAAPAGIDRELASRGYTSEIACSDMAKAVVGYTVPTEVSVTAEPLAEWLDLYVAEQPAEKKAELPLIRAKLPIPHGFILCKRSGVAAGVALVARVGDDAAIDCVLTRPEFRRCGVGRAIMLAAEAWATRHGVRRLVLSVVDDNAGALALYRSLGYRRLSAYHYRVAAA